MRKKSFIVLIICVILISWCILIYYIWMSTIPFMALNCPNWTKKVIGYLQWYKTKRCEDKNWKKVIAYYKTGGELAVAKYKEWILYEVNSYWEPKYGFDADKEKVVCHYENNHEYCEIYKYEDWEKSFIIWIKNLITKWIWDIFSEKPLDYSANNLCKDEPLWWITRSKDYPPFGVYCNTADWESKKYSTNWQLNYYRQYKEWVLERMVHYFDNWQVEYEKEYIDEENLKQDVTYYNKDWTINHIEYIDRISNI